MAFIKLPIPVDSKYLNPARLPESFPTATSFPKVNRTGFMIGWGQNSSNLLDTTNNNLLQKIVLTTSNRSTLPCNVSYPYTSYEDASYSVNLKLLILKF